MSSCRFCNAELKETFANLGMSPLSNRYIEKDALQAMEPFYPLHAYVCSECLLVQLEEFESPEEIFSDYAYFSSYSESWLEHARSYVNQMKERLNLTADSQVVEIASNDGYLLQYFKELGIPVLGVEPAANVAKVAIDKGVPTEVLFFGDQTAKDLSERYNKADLILGNNVLAHVPDLNGFVKGLKILLKDSGTVTMEFPHLLRLIESSQFDTIYHEHFSYFSLLALEKVFGKQGLRIFDVDELPTHGGSLRIYVCHDENASLPTNTSVLKLRETELSYGLGELKIYREFHKKVEELKRNTLEFLINAKREGKVVVGYGAPAKGNTFLNYCGIRTDFLDYTVDRSPHKQGRYLPGSHVPIKEPNAIKASKPDYVMILPWNLREEISQQMSYIRDWGGQFVVGVPSLEVF